MMGLPGEKSGRRVREVAEYRQYAEDCRKLARALTNPEDKKALQSMAAAWEKVARNESSA